jgi:hypothetical protein
MRKFILVVVVACTTLFFTGCEKPTKQQELVEFGGLKVNLSENLDPDILFMDFEDLKRKYQKSRMHAGYRFTEELDIPLDIMVEMVENVFSDYANTDSLTDEGILEIQSVFYELESHEIAENIETIDSFYVAFMRDQLIDCLANYDNSNQRQYDNYGLNSAEKWALIWRPRMIGPTRDATKKSMELSDEHYPNSNGYQTKKDAFRHSLWNALIAKYAGAKKNKIWKCVKWAKKFTDKHEECSEKPDNLTDEEFAFDQAMDYHNNEIGRDYFESVAWTYKKNWRTRRRVKSPSADDMAATIYEKSEAGVQVANKNEISNYPDVLVYIVE